MPYWLTYHTFYYNFPQQPEEKLNMARICYKVGDADTRPWGTWKVTAVGDDTIEKEIVVNPDGQLSEQRHFGREEVWTILEGSGTVTLGRDEEGDTRIIPVSAGDVVTIPLQTWHRMHNTGTVNLVFHEVQRAAGEQGRLDEGDIERGKDRYGRGTAQAPDPAVVEAHAEVLDLHRT